MLKQRTLKQQVRTTGVGLHSGTKVQLTLRPAAVDTGIVFRRVDLDPVVEFPASAGVVGDTPASVLTSLPGVGIARASAYGAALGDPSRFASEGTAWRYSGLVPVEHDSAGTKRPGMQISREGTAPLREAILEIGKGLSDHHPEFRAYKRQKIAQGKKKTVAAVAVAHRAHRLAFAMMRTQTVFDPDRWDQSTVGGPVTAAESDRHDVTHPPLLTMAALG